MEPQIFRRRAYESAPRFQLRVDLCNDAFHPDAVGELVRILCGIVERLATDPADSATVLDRNGNSVGRWTLDGVEG